MERVWAIGYQKGSNNVAIGFDDGVVMIKVGREEPVASMDASGKIIWARHNEIQTVNVKSLGSDYEIADGERLPLAVKDLGACDIYPQVRRHSVVVPACLFKSIDEARSQVLQSCATIECYSQVFGAAYQPSSTRSALQRQTRSPHAMWSHVL